MLNENLVLALVQLALYPLIWYKHASVNTHSISVVFESQYLHLHDTCLRRLHA
jgi:hypothetical protein